MLFDDMLIFILFGFESVKIWRLCFNASTDKWKCTETLTHTNCALIVLVNHLLWLEYKHEILFSAVYSFGGTHKSFWYWDRSLIISMHLWKTINAFSLLGQQQRWSWLERPFLGVIRAVTCTQWRITIVYLGSESILLF